MTTKIAINGFGRIGRNVLRAMLKRDMLKAGSDVEIVALNDLTSPETLAHLLQYDSVHGELPYEVTVSDKAISVNGIQIKVCAETDPAKLPWKELGVDIVVESTGRFTKGPDAAKHIQAGAKKVIISAPGKDIDATIVMGVNDHTYDPANHHVVSNASCTTNCLAPFAKVLHEQFGIVRGLMTTVHAYTNDQRILDLPHSDLRRARAAGQSIIPTTTGAAKAVALVLPELKGKLNGFAMRVPTPNVSVVDLVVELEKPATEEAINSALKAAAEGPLKGILAFCEKPLVSRDFNGNPHSSIVDAPSTMILDGKMAKVVSWYDNEWGYSNRVVDLALLMAAKGL
ncbi:type I glyceraldehyde-3-phosphate dehydrogenase [Heliobacterium gestii]|uniref:Glyceraldehyde-3-phosphate dehydrogenase n=1 Tax=Heliomicrobium gestii TaxID=2699 RepID=A0A845LAV5_HELGE|nr:type I glyceraldehyde-3-phosphate dehydrogenase [Heliomicrobium gestii]MBM7865963.1 glyceraldehyde 3-phosphate dehydrogenase [Heliomicrobium gestii]MZP42701.1 type I glyceraldehyde-3-phosphate dehydrogenase [Heliomicrobium gestii]